MVTRVCLLIFALLVVAVFCSSWFGCTGTTYTLTTSVQGDGCSVTLNPSGGSYTAGTTVALTPVAPAGYRFDHWEGGITGNSNPGVIIIAQDTSVVVVFVASVFADLRLEAAIRAAIGKPTGDILMSDLLTITSLDASGLGITNLEGLQYCTNLTDLNLTYNAISDVTPLGSLTNLQELDLSNNTISNIAPLASLVNLEHVYLESNQIADVSPLSGLANLETLSLAHNPLSVIDALVADPNIGSGDVVDLRGTYLTLDDCPAIFALLDRGVDDVINDLTCEGEPVCPVESATDTEGAEVYTAISTSSLNLDWYTSDLDGNGIPDNWEAAVVSEVLCDRHGALYGPVRSLYQSTLALLATEDAYLDVLHTVEHAIIIMSLVSHGLFNAVVAQAQIDSADVVTLDYPSFTVGGVEVFSASGDPDGDGLTNKQEYDNVIAAGGTRSDYVAAVLGLP